MNLCEPRNICPIRLSIKVLYITFFSLNYWTKVLPVLWINFIHDRPKLISGHGSCIIKSCSHQKPSILSMFHWDWICMLVVVNKTFPIPSLDTLWLYANLYHYHGFQWPKFFYVSKSYLSILRNFAVSLSAKILKLLDMLDMLGSYINCLCLWGNARLQTEAMRYVILCGSCTIAKLLTL